MILVTGATGTVGGEVLRLLAARGIQTRAMTREPARPRTHGGVDVGQADFERADSLRGAVACWRRTLSPNRGPIYRSPAAPRPGIVTDAAPGESNTGSCVVATREGCRRGSLGGL